MISADIFHGDAALARGEQGGQDPEVAPRDGVAVLEPELEQVAVQIQGPRIAPEMRQEALQGPKLPGFSGCILLPQMRV